MDTLALLTVLFSCAFMFLLFRALWKMLTSSPLEGEDSQNRVLKIFLPTIISGILIILFFIFVLPKYH